MLIWYKKERGGGILYTIHQWLLLFYLYCFAGWIWESCYVSLKKRKWINRGFLKGPLLPIYGSGAIVVLVSTIMVQNNTFLIFIIGMIAATILEYITGELMEKGYSMLDIGIIVISHLILMDIYVYYHLWLGEYFRCF